MSSRIESLRPLTFGFVLALVALVGACAASPDTSRHRVDLHANLNAGIRAYEAKDYRMAVRQLEIAIVADPTNPDSFFRLAQSHRALGNYRRALKYIRLALELDPNHLAALKERGLVLLDAGQTAEAKVTLEQLGKKCKHACPEYESLKQLVAAAAPKKDS